ncbi:MULTISPECIES: DUF3368 domain-containing protein [Methylobacterium]|uniref:DUF3368 domain-containing protein n=1 Tax=Methylobacterium TaxID=407 RepID=UPI001EDCD46E|nr:MULTISPECIES: DUF3368 domain-containing protein [Methylobacterium]
MSDTGPLNYLVLIDHAHVLKPLFGSLLIPEAVRRELGHPGAPARVQTWIAASPGWLSVHPDSADTDATLHRLGDGERQAIVLARARAATLILMDDRAGVAAARAMGSVVIGTLGIIDLAARRGLLDVAQAVARLRNTNFRCRPSLLFDLLARHRAS